MGEAMFPIFPAWFLVVGATLGILAGCTAGAGDCAATATCPAPLESDSDASTTLQQELALGANCSAAEECSSGHCVDGKCCESACDGACERCDVPGFAGQCTPTPEGLDPDDECVGGGDPACAGACDGNRACRFPDESTWCGVMSCTDGLQSGFACNGEGACVDVKVACGDYTCDSEVCRSTCEAESDCATSAYCEDGACRPRKGNGEACSDDGQCQSGYCIDGVCCATACEAPWSCSSGECLCNGVACGEGKTCTVYVLDRDEDGYPASSANDVIGCSGEPPPPFEGHAYIDSSGAQLDCDDADPEVHPGQKKFFTSPRKNSGGFDYDCDGVETKQYGPGGNLRVCTVCEDLGDFCGVGLGFANDPCNQVPAAFTNLAVAPACGTTGTLRRCKATGACQAGESETETATQGCR